MPLLWLVLSSLINGDSGANHGECKTPFPDLSGKLTYRAIA
jgi:hypothetical protein